MAHKKEPAVKLKSRGKRADQGEPAKAKSASSTNMQPMPRQFARGVGTEFAYAVKNVLDESKHMKGSDSGFLGVDKEILDPKDYNHSLLQK